MEDEGHSAAATPRNASDARPDDGTRKATARKLASALPGSQLADIRKLMPNYLGTGALGAGTQLARLKLISDRVRAITEMPGLSVNRLGHEAFLGQFAETIRRLNLQQTVTETALTAAFEPLMAQRRLFDSQLTQILGSQLAITRFAGVTDFARYPALTEAITRYSTIHAELGSLAAGPGHTELLRGLSRASDRLYASYLGTLPAQPSIRRAAVARFAGDTQSGILIAESLTAPGLSEDDRNDLADEFTVGVLEPWQSGPDQARRELLEAMAELAPGHEDWIKGAWEDIVRNGPKAASKIAECAVEAVDQTLRILAPVEAVMTWMTANGRRGPAWWSDRGTPTRRAKIMYAMRDRAAKDGRLVAAQAECLAVLVQDSMGALQAVKHPGAPVPTMATMRGYVLACESALSQLLLHH